MIQPNVLKANTVNLLDSGGTLYLLGVEVLAGQPHLTQTVESPGPPVSTVYILDSLTGQTYLLGITTSGQLTLTVASSNPLQTSQLLLADASNDFFVVKVFNAEFNIALAPAQASPAPPAQPPASAAGQLVPLDNAPNQTWQVSVAVNGGVQTFFATLRYNEIAGYWAMTLQDANQNLLLDSVPLLTGLNLTHQFQSLGIGDVYILNVSGVAQDSPTGADLGTDFQLVWTDNTEFSEAA